MICAWHCCLMRRGYGWVRFGARTAEEYHCCPCHLLFMHVFLCVFVCPVCVFMCVCGPCARAGCLLHYHTQTHGQASFCYQRQRQVWHAEWTNATLVSWAWKDTVIYSCLGVCSRSLSLTHGVCAYVCVCVVIGGLNEKCLTLLRLRPTWSLMANLWMKACWTTKRMLAVEIDFSFTTIRKNVSILKYTF